jgi:hypothetical protein
LHKKYLAFLEPNPITAVFWGRVIFEFFPQTEEGEIWFTLVEAGFRVYSI